MNTPDEDLLERLHDRTRHLKTFLAAAEQAANESVMLVHQIGEGERGEVEAHYNQLADAEETLHSIATELGQVMGELEQTLIPEKEDDA
jgi:hypothetical protein